MGVLLREEGPHGVAVGLSASRPAQDCPRSERVYVRTYVRKWFWNA